MSAASAKRKPIDIDRRIVRNREEADRLDERLSTIRLRPVKADERLRGHMTTEKEVPSTFDAPDSNIVLHGEYSEVSGRLVLHLKQGKDKYRIYDYTGVSPELWAEFVAAESKGSYFTQFIRPKFLGKARGEPRPIT